MFYTQCEIVQCPKNPNMDVKFVCEYASICGKMKQEEKK